MESKVLSPPEVYRPLLQAYLAGAASVPGAEASRAGTTHAGAALGAAGCSRHTARDAPAPTAAPGRYGRGTGRRRRQELRPEGKPAAPVRTRSAARPRPRTYDEATASRSSPGTHPPPSWGQGSTRTPPYPGEGGGTSSNQGLEPTQRGGGSSQRRRGPDPTRASASIRPHPEGQGHPYTSAVSASPFPGKKWYRPRSPSNRLRRQTHSTSD